MFQDASAKYKTKYDYVFKVDDDTYVTIDRLFRVIDKQDFPR